MGYFFFMCFPSSVDFKLLLLAQTPLVTHQAQRRNPRLFCLLWICIICKLHKAISLLWWFQVYAEQGPIHQSTPFPASPSPHLTPFLFPDHCTFTYSLPFIHPSRFQKRGGKWNSLSNPFYFSLFSKKQSSFHPSISPTCPPAPSSKLNRRDSQ